MNSSRPIEVEKNQTGQLIIYSVRNKFLLIRRMISDSSLPVTHECYTYKIAVRTNVHIPYRCKAELEPYQRLCKQTRDKNRKCHLGDCKTFLRIFFFFIFFPS